MKPFALKYQSTIVGQLAVCRETLQPTAGVSWPFHFIGNSLGLRQVDLVFVAFKEFFQRPARSVH